MTSISTPSTPSIPSAPSTLRDPRVAEPLRRLFAAAQQDDAAYQRALARSPEGFTDTDAQQRADAWSEIYMPISADAGRLLYTLVRAVKPRTVIEFGMSYGISTLHLAAAVRDNGVGHVVTTEMSAAKIEAARATFEEAGLRDVVTILQGDALQSIPKHLDADGAGSDVDFVLLDGWKDLYTPVLRALEPHLVPGALVIADDTSFDSVQPYLAYVRDPANGYEGVTFPVEDGMEISCRL
ncbi:O-methyltransferase family 3 [Catenulispora acidiphila DSM 44928]|uniref:O-methyltransferase family 3 n=1 Tax=Catenulispora acidiphila (strain DSM 44928 / JCM 14897 / NBRC 102108 / NRRL B-24433 / ID139908) TaxID=479433 RepID=C7QJY6_CATAD|nr:CmcI family methyltransferase [Catenulispora acidiphila]ACU73224.1 O-methyltransferase family 3 [Catenulispora acidiphila DSM 44928]